MLESAQTRSGNKMKIDAAISVDPGAPQAVINQPRAKARPCSLDLQLNRPDTKHAYTRMFAKGKVPGALEFEDTVSQKTRH